MRSTKAEILPIVFFVVLIILVWMLFFVFGA